MFQGRTNISTNRRCRVLLLAVLTSMWPAIPNTSRQSSLNVSCRRSPANACSAMIGRIWSCWNFPTMHGVHSGGRNLSERHRPAALSASRRLRASGGCLRRQITLRTHQPRNIRTVARKVVAALWAIRLLHALPTKAAKVGFGEVAHGSGRETHGGKFAQPPRGVRNVGWT
jgi:hypothetical protein